MSTRDNNAVCWGSSPVRHGGLGGTGTFVERDGETYYRIANYHRMPPFFITVVSGYDHWMFLSSNGGLTCGRRDPDNALFPYYTDDKIHDADTTTGPQTILLVEKEGARHLWKPFARDVPVYRMQRNLYKNLLGNRLIFEEVNQDLGLVFSYEWSTGDRFGFVRKSVVLNSGAEETGIAIVDGFRNLLPQGVDRRTQATLSTLVDAYKQAEAVPGLPAAIYSLSSVPTDRAEPNEALRATVAWCLGLDDPCLLLSEEQVDAFCAGFQPDPETFKMGQRGAFFVHSVFVVRPDEEKNWFLVADVDQGPVQAAELLEAARRGVAEEAVELDVAGGTQRLRQLVGSADGFQLSSDPLVNGRHRSNTLFNIMRGGTFHDGYNFPTADFLDFVESWNRSLRRKFEGALDTRQERLTRTTVLAAARNCGDPDMERLALEYLPLVFSRRHGDPSRPWNQFSIDIRNADGSPQLHYQGNWRDIFQNWDALAISYPDYIESFIAKFVNASTADGYNPYRISRDGFDWEVLDPDDPWSNIGYWGDHQVNYLLELLELSWHYHPGRLGQLLGRDLFVYANVPYRLKPYGEQLKDPKSTLDYDPPRAAVIGERVQRIGSDGKLVALADGSIYKVKLVEKLLLAALVRIGNFVPGGGIWMNTQRPEWNDANNALVGHGLSMVTLCYLRRFLVLLAALLGEQAVERFAVSREVADFLRGLDGVLGKYRSILGGPIAARDRKAFMDETGVLGESYRAEVYAGFSGQRSELETQALSAFIGLALEYLDHSIGHNRRDDGMFHSYNLVHFAEDGYEVEHLCEMLEGQVAVLNSGFLDPGGSLLLLDALQASALFRADRASYMLYPERKLPPFLAKNVIPESLVAHNAWIRDELETGRSRYIERDVNGRVHFHGRFRNERELRMELQEDLTVSDAEADALCEAYELVFRHRQFTGRSGTMYKYEGIGCIYWHMVSKLALAISEVLRQASSRGADADLVDSLYQRLERVREGLGIHATPARYGAFPLDPYSHTPGFAGAQQPGMTGQVKEDIISRFSELGVCVNAGEIAFEPVTLKRSEFLSEPAAWTYSAGGEERQQALQAGSLAFTLCGVPVIYRLGEAGSIRVFRDQEDEPEVIRGTRLGQSWSRSLFLREGRIRKIEVDIPQAVLR